MMTDRERTIVMLFALVHVGQIASRLAMLQACRHERKPTRHAG